MDEINSETLKLLNNSNQGFNRINTDNANDEFYWLGYYNYTQNGMFNAGTDPVTTGSFSVSFFITRNGASNPRQWLIGTHYAYEFAIVLEANAGEVTTFIGGHASSSYNPQITGQGKVGNQQTHFAFVKNSTGANTFKMDFYINGVLTKEATFTVNIGSTNGNMLIGANDFNYLVPFNGTLEKLIYMKHRVLNQNDIDILKNYNNY